MTPQLQPTPFLRVDPVRQRLIEPVSERRRVAVGFEHENVDGIQIRPQPETARILAGEDEASFDDLAVFVRPSAESIGALVGISAINPIR